MPLSARLPRLLAALSLTLPLLSAAQTPALTDAERARRDAEKVLSFIKFQTVRTKPADAADKPRKPAPSRPAATAHAAHAADSGAAPAAAAAAQALTPATEPLATPVPEPAAAPFAAPVSQPAATPPQPAEPEPDADDADEVPLQLQRYVAPVLPPSVQATLVGGSRKVTVRFTVEANGSVSRAEAAADTPRRLARPATDAVLQWQFAPLAQPRTVDVDIAFRRE